MIFRQALQDEVKRRETEELKEEMEKLKPVLKKVSTYEIVKSIREDKHIR